MAKKSGTYRITGADQSVARFMSRNRVSTDALNALITWRDKAPGRDFETLQDEDECLAAKLSFDDTDTRAGLDLDGQAITFGVEFTHAPEA